MRGRSLVTPPFLPRRRELPLSSSCPLLLGGISNHRSFPGALVTIAFCPSARAVDYKNPRQIRVTTTREIARRAAVASCNRYATRRALFAIAGVLFRQTRHDCDSGGRPRRSVR